jgi:hypothetical protein
VAVVAVALDHQGVEHPLLVRVGPHVEVGEGDRRGLPDRAPLVLTQRLRELLAVALGVVGDEVLGLPVAGEGHPHPVDHVAGIDGREPHVPLEAVEERGVGEVGGADEGGAQARAPLQQPGLGVQLGGARVERHPHLGAQLDQLVHRPFLGRAHVGGGDDAQSAAALDEVGEGLAQLAHAGPDHEGAEQIDRVGGGDLATQLGADVGLALGVDQQVALGEGRRWRRGQLGDGAERRPPAYPLEDASRQLDLGGPRLLGRYRLRQQSVHSLCLGVRGLFAI